MRDGMVVVEIGVCGVCRVVGVWGGERIAQIQTVICNLLVFYITTLQLPIY